MELKCVMLKPEVSEFNGFFFSCHFFFLSTCFLFFVLRFGTSLANIKTVRDSKLHKTVLFLGFRDWGNINK